MAELVEGAPLLREYGVKNSIEGSNPSLSAIIYEGKACAAGRPRYRAPAATCHAPLCGMMRYRKARRLAKRGGVKPWGAL